MYVKAELADGVEIKVDITDENVFDICPQCGEEIPIVLDSCLNQGISVIGTSFYCGSCSAKIREHRR